MTLACPGKWRALTASNRLSIVRNSAAFSVISLGSGKQGCDRSRSMCEAWQEPINVSQLHGMATFRRCHWIVCDAREPACRHDTHKRHSPTSTVARVRRMLARVPANVYSWHVAPRAVSMASMNCISSDNVPGVPCTLAYPMTE
jgi:hypothetical protein